MVEVPQSGQLLYQVSLEEAQEQDPNVQLGDTIVMLTGSGTRAGGSSEYILGTDQLGRDIFSRIIYGARISLIVAAVTLVVGGGIGVVVGLVSGYYGGWVDELLMRLVDIILALPLILVALVLVVAVGQSFEMIIAVLALWIWPRFARMVRGEVLQLKTLDYVALARVAGASTPRILFIHLFPGTINTVILVATLQVGIVILVEATLSFPGRGSSAAGPGVGVDGGRRARPAGRRLVGGHDAGHCDPGDGDVAEPLWRLAAGQAGPQAPPDRVGGTGRRQVRGATTPLAGRSNRLAVTQRAGSHSASTGGRCPVWT